MAGAQYANRQEWTALISIGHGGCHHNHLGECVLFVSAEAGFTRTILRGRTEALLYYYNTR